MQLNFEHLLKLPKHPGSTYQIDNILGLQKKVSTNYNKTNYHPTYSEGSLVGFPTQLWGIKCEAPP